MSRRQKEFLTAKEKSLFLKKVSDYMFIHKYKNKDFAKYCGVSQGTMSRLLLNKCVMSKAVFHLIINKLKITEEEAISDNTIPLNPVIKPENVIKQPYTQEKIELEAMIEVYKKLSNYNQYLVYQLAVQLSAANAIDDFKKKIMEL